MKVALLAGGTGGTKLAHGFALADPKLELAVVANVADDAEIHGLHVSPDVDALLYTFAGLIDPERGWGVRDDTLSAHAMFERLGQPTWFTLGDADLATQVTRTRLLGDGATLTEATEGMARALGLPPSIRILPASDDRHRTVLLTDAGELPFQEYFVRRRQEPEVRAVRFDGAARPTPQVIEAIAAADLVVIGPSNPFVSIEPVLALPGVRGALSETPAPTIAVSPIVAGAPLKGPADRMLVSLGHEATARGVARLYAGVATRFVIDEADAALRSAIESETGMAVTVLPTIMRTDADRRALADALLATSAEG